MVNRADCRADRHAHRQGRAPQAVQVVQRGGNSSSCRYQADLADTFDPIGGSGLGCLDEDDLDNRHVLRADYAKAPEGHVLWPPLIITREFLRQSVAEAHVHGPLDLALAQERIDRASHVVDRHDPVDLAGVAIDDHQLCGE